MREPHFMNLFPKSWNALPPEIQQRRLEDPDLLKQNHPKFSLETEFGMIDYVRTGKPGAKVLLFIPGTPDQHFAFHRLMLALAPEFDCLAISPPGKGYSSYNERFDFRPDTVAKFWKMIADLFAFQNVTVIAHSTGVNDIVHALLDFGQEALGIDGLVSVCGWAPCVHPEPIELPFVERALGTRFGHRLYRWFSETRWFGLTSMLRQYLFRYLAEEDFQRLAREVFRSWPRRDVKSGEFDHEMIRGICESLRQQRLLNRRPAAYARAQTKNHWRLFGLPVLSLSASHDVVIRAKVDRFSGAWGGGFRRYQDANGRSYAERLHHTLGELTGFHTAHRSVTVGGSGHLLPLEAPAEMAREIAAFNTNLAHASPTENAAALYQEAKEIENHEIKQPVGAHNGSYTLPAFGFRRPLGRPVWVHS